VIKGVDMINLIKEQILIKLVNGVARGFVNSLLKDVKPVDVYEAIKNDVSIWGELPESIKKRGERIKREFERRGFSRYFDMLNEDVIRKWLQEDHPDLYSTIVNTPSGEEWFRREVQSLLDALGLRKNLNEKQ